MLEKGGQSNMMVHYKYEKDKNCLYFIRHYQEMIGIF